MSIKIDAKDIVNSAMSIKIAAIQTYAEYNVPRFTKIKYKR